MQNSVGDITLFEYRGKKITVDKPRLQNGTSTDSIIKETSYLRSLINDLSNELQNFIKHYNDDNVHKSNALKTSIERTIKSSGDTIVNNLVSGVTSTTGSTSTISAPIRVSKTVTAGVTYPELYSSPALLPLPPLVFTIVDGMFSAQWCYLQNETVTGFEAIPPIDGEMRYFYLLL